MIHHRIPIYLQFLFTIAIISLCTFLTLYWFDISFIEFSQFALYETCFILLPGILTYQLIVRPTDNLFKQIIIGWSLGYLVEILFYISTATFGLWDWFVWYPILFLPLFLYKIRPFYKRLQSVKCSSRSIRILWILSAVYLIVLSYISLTYFADAPLPENIERANYHVDVGFHLSIAAIAKHNWPITDPQVVNGPLPYYKFVYIHLAAVSRTTGLPLTLVFFRLYIIPLLFLLVMQVYVLALSLTKNYRVGLLSVLLVFCVGELDPFIGSHNLFYGDFLPHLFYSSPTYLFGFIFFIPFVILANSLFEQVPSSTKHTNIFLWLFISALFFACLHTKSVISLVILGGLVLYIMGRVYLSQHIPRQAIILFLISTVIFYISRETTYSALEYSLMDLLKPLTSISALPLTKHCVNLLPTTNYYKAACYMGAILPNLVGLLGIRVLGVVWFIREYKLGLSSGQLWFASLAASSFFIFYSMINAIAGYGIWYGYLTINVIAAQGLYLLWTKHRNKFFVSLRMTMASSVILAVFFIGALDYPLDNIGHLPNLIHKKIPATYLDNNKNLTPELLEGLEWVRDNTPTTAVLAVNNHYRDVANTSAYYTYYPAFTERITFLGGWMYSVNTHNLGYYLPENLKDKETKWKDLPHPYPDRLNLNQRLFENVDKNAAQILSDQYGVTHLLVDKSDHGKILLLDIVANLIYSNQAVDVWEVNIGE